MYKNLQIFWNVINSKWPSNKEVYKQVFWDPWISNTEIKSKKLATGTALPFFSFVSREIAVTLERAVL